MIKHNDDNPQCIYEDIPHNCEMNCLFQVEIKVAKSQPRIFEKMLNSAYHTEKCYPSQLWEYIKSVKKKRVICVLNAISKQVEKFCFKVNGDEIKVSL